MNLKVALPTQILLDRKVEKIIAEGENGEFCLLPRHIDFVSSLVPGILSAVDEEGGEEFVAVDRGILVKAGDDVFVSTWRGACCADLGELEKTVAEKYRVLDDHEKKARSALARLEAGIVKKFNERR